MEVYTNGNASQPECTNSFRGKHKLGILFTVPKNFTVALNCHLRTFNLRCALAVWSRESICIVKFKSNLFLAHDTNAYSRLLSKSVLYHTKSLAADLKLVNNLSKLLLGNLVEVFLKWSNEHATHIH